MGNQQAKAEAKVAAENYNSGQEHILLVPVPIGENGNQFGVDVIEPGFQGIETLQNMLHEYFNHRIKRYILGQIGSSETEAGGLGSGQSEFHQDTLLQIIKSDATDHEETITSELVDSIIKINVQKKVWDDPGFVPRFVAETEEDDIKEKLEACTQLMDRGIKFRSKDLYELVGMAMPGPGDEVNPDQPAQGGGMGMDGMPKPGAEDQSQPSLNPDDETLPRDPDQPPKPDSEAHTQRYSRRSFTRSAIPFRKLQRVGK
jgi:phage gp29-like protein